MKTILLSLLSLTLLSSFTLFNEPSQERKAVVNQIDGIYVFVDSQPMDDYEILGSFDRYLVLTREYKHIRDTLVRKVKKKYPEADALVIYFNNWGPNIGYAIRFRE